MTPTPPLSRIEKNLNRVVLLGSTGMLGSDLALSLAQYFSEASVFLPSRADCNLGDEKNGVAYLEKIGPKFIVNAAAFANVDKAETDRDAAFMANVSGPEWLARYSNGSGAKLIHFGTDQIFDGKKGQPYSETDYPNPLNYYAETKYLGEQTVLKYPTSVVMRVQWLYGRTRDRFTPLKNKTEFTAFSDQFGAPTWTEELCRWAMPVILGDSRGVFHMVHDDYASWADIFRFVAETTGWKVVIKEIKTEEAKLAARRPNFSVLSNAKLKAFLGLNSLGSYKTPLKKFLLP